MKKLTNLLNNKNLVIKLKKVMINEIMTWEKILISLKNNKNKFKKMTKIQSIKVEYIFMDKYILIQRNVYIS